VSITNAPGAASYPISSFTWLLVRRDNRDAAKARQIRDFLSWMISPEAQQIAKELHYSPLPQEVVGLVRARIAALKAAGRAIAAN
jgi:phosphate transport system substrate-binding protein